MVFKHTTNDAFRGLGNRERQIVGRLHQLEAIVITSALLEKEFGFTRSQANLTLSRLCKKGWLQRLRAGAYSLVELSSFSVKLMPKNPQALAMELFRPCFISGWSAAEHWEFTEQIFNTIVVFSTESQRTNKFTIAGVHYRVQKISKEHFFGTQKFWSGTTQIEIADPHRTLLDILNNPELGGGGRLTLEIARVYFQSSLKNYDILFAYAVRLNNGTVFKRLGFLAETLGQVPLEFLEKCKAKLTKGVSLFDPKGPEQGSIKSRWNLRINVPVQDVI